MKTSSQLQQSLGWIYFHSKPQRYSHRKILEWINNFILCIKKHWLLDIQHLFGNNILAYMDLQKKDTLCTHIPVTQTLHDSHRVPNYRLLDCLVGRLSWLTRKQRPKLCINGHLWWKSTSYVVDLHNKRPVKQKALPCFKSTSSLSSLLHMKYINVDNGISYSSSNKAPLLVWHTTLNLSFPANIVSLYRQSVAPFTNMV